MFPPEKVVPLGAVQRLGGFENRSEVKLAVCELEERSIVSGMKDGVVNVHGLMHEYLETKESKFDGSGVGHELFPGLPFRGWQHGLGCIDALQSGV